MSPYTIVSRKFTHVLVKKQLESQQRQLGKIAVVKAETYIVYRKTTVYGLEAGKTAFFENTYKLSIAMRSRISWACLWVWAYIVIIVAEPGFIIQDDRVQAPCDTLCNNLSLAGKRPVWIKLSLSQIQYLRKVPGFPSAGHIWYLIGYHQECNNHKQ